MNAITALKMPLLVISIEDIKVETKSGTKDGKDWEIHEQKGYAHLFDQDGQPKKYPTEIKVSCRVDESGKPNPYKVGKYTLDPVCFYVGKYDSLSLARLQLVALPELPASKS